MRFAGGSPPCLGQSSQVYARAWRRAGSRPGSVSHEMFLDASSGRTTRQVDHVPDVQALADFAQLRARGRKESAEQPVPLEILYPSLPALSTTAQPLEDPGQLRRNRGLSLANEAAHVIDQLH
jgi:hypothetical protein